MKIVKAFVVLGLCAFVLEFYRDWSDLSGNGNAADSSTMTLPVNEDKVTEDAQTVDDATAEETNMATEDTDTTESPAIDEVKSNAEQEDAIQRIDMTYTRTTLRV